MNKETTKIKYFAYVRKSTEGEERQALSIPAQKDKLNEIFDKLTIAKIPAKLRMKDTNKNCQFLRRLKPKRPMPISSGKGEAIMRAPSTGASQAK